MTRVRRGYTEEFKAEAIRLARAGEKPIRKVAQELGMPAGTLTCWVRAGERKDQGGAEKLSDSERQELQRLRRENQRLQQERDFLKKAAAFFAKENT